MSEERRVHEGSGDLPSWTTKKTKTSHLAVVSNLFFIICTSCLEMFHTSSCADNDGNGLDPGSPPEAVPARPSPPASTTGKPESQNFRV